MNKVSIINFNLHKKFLIEDPKQELPKTGFKHSIKRRNKSPQDTLKKLIKKGLVNFVSPYSRPKSSFKSTSDKENAFFRHSQNVSPFHEMSHTNKYQSSSSLFTCSRGHGTSFNSKCRVHTEDRDEGQGNTRYLLNKALKGLDYEEILQPGSHMFRDFRNISEQSVSRLNIEHQRRTVKLQDVHKSKYDSAWKKYPVPSKSKSKKKSEHIQGPRKGIL